ncbi:response regulator [Sphingobium sufflavum]|uniref:response regulator n=1 Tax=Sphingobium sufflavum TaxID=1129547 RepID=UPI001F1F73BF|nr:response regulator [Sphingobium sufflavum]
MEKSVLIVEDEALIRALCVDVFEEAGFAVSEAETGDQALAMLEDGLAVTAIVSDVRMPGAVDGMALREEVHRRWPRTRFLLTSGHLHVDRDILSEGEAFLPKPYRFLEMVSEVEALLILKA